MPSDPSRKIIILENDQTRRDYFRSLVRDWGHTPFCFDKETTCFDNLTAIRPHLVIIGHLPAHRIVRSFTTISTVSGELPVLIQSSDSAVQTFIETSGFENVRLIGNGNQSGEIRRVIDDVQPDWSGNGTLPVTRIIGNDPAIVRLKRMVLDLADSNETILIKGEPGTGKELLARALHGQSRLRNNAFVKINAAEIGRLQPKSTEPLSPFYNLGDIFDDRGGGGGMLRKGTVFIDDIEELPAACQAEMLRVVRDCGSSPAVGVGEARDVRIVAATSSPLEYWVERSQFRKDLYYRLNVISLEVPPLRERLGDIPLLADYFADMFCLLIGKSYCELSENTKSVFLRYPWPDNVRELQSAVKAAVLTEGEKGVVDRICRGAQDSECRNFPDFEDVYSLAEIQQMEGYLGHLEGRGLKSLCHEFIVRAEKKVILQVLEASGWNRKKAANVLNISYRSLLNKIKEYHITNS